MLGACAMNCVPDTVEAILGAEGVGAQMFGHLDDQWDSIGIHPTRAQKKKEKLNDQRVGNLFAMRPLCFTLHGN